MTLNARATCSMFAAAMLGLMIVPIAFVGFEPQVDIRSTDSLVQITNPESRASGNPPEFLSTPPDPTLGDAGVPISFTVVVLDLDDDTVNVTWDWGDGVIETNLTLPAASLQIVQRYHTYNPISLPQGGNEDFTLNVSLDDGNGNIVWDLTTVSVVRPPNGPPAIISVSVTFSGSKIRVNPGDEVTIVANASDPEGELLTWTYAFNDSVSDYLIGVHITPQSEPGAIVWSNISTVFDAVGEYRVKVNVSDAPPPYQIWPHNVSETVDISVVENTPPAMSENISVVPDSPVLDLSIGYVVVCYEIETADSDGDIVTATWDFGDGSPVEQNVSSGGDYGLSTFLQSRNYTAEGSFNISVTVTDGRPGHDVTRNVTVTIRVLNHRPVASFTVDPLTGDTSTDFVFDASSSSDIETPADNLMVRWDFDNDGTWDTGWSTWKLMNHTFSAPGTYTVVLEVRDTSGLTNTTTLDVVVAEAIPEFDGLLTPILLLAFMLVLCRWRMLPRTR